MSQNVLKCPNCGAEVPIHEGWEPWCEVCQWNLIPRVTRLRRKNAFDQVYEQLSARSRDLVYREVCAEAEQVRFWNHRVVLAYGFSALIYGVSFSLLIIGVWGLISGNTLADCIVALVCLALGFQALPRFSRTRYKELDPQAYPHIHSLVNALVSRMSCDPIHRIYLDHSFNAFYFRRGFRGQGCLVIGIPLFSILTLEEIAGVLAHELGHHKNKDISRHIFNYWAMNTLSRQYAFWDGFLEGKITRILFWPPKALVLGLIYVMGGLIWKERQKAEYRADLEGARMVGVQAMLSLGEKINYSELFFNTLEKIGQSSQNTGLFERFRYRIQFMPERELRRMKAIEATHTQTLHSSHPPSDLRRDFLKTRKELDKPDDLAGIDQGAVLDEFRRLEESVQKYLVSQYREMYVYESRW